MNNFEKLFHDLATEGESFAQLPAWAGFQRRQGVYGGVDQSEASKGFTTIALGGEMVGYDAPLSNAHRNAIQYLVDHQQAIQQTILTALLKDYIDWQSDYGYDEEEAAEIMPDVDDIDGFRPLIGLSYIHIMHVEKDDHAYVGYQFGCTWDEEHGIGVMMHKDRIVKIGGSDTSFLAWVAKGDLKPKI